MMARQARVLLKTLRTSLLTKTGMVILLAMMPDIARMYFLGKNEKELKKIVKKVESLYLLLDLSKGDI